jgi:hypothetical protein
MSYTGKPTQQQEEEHTSPTENDEAAKVHFVHQDEPMLQPTSEEKLHHILQIPSNIWGPGGWRFLEQFFQWGETFHETNIQADYAVRRLYYVHHFLPGKGCKVKLGAYIRGEETSPKPGEDRGKWLWMLHNSINERLGKPFYDERAAQKNWFKLTFDRPRFSDWDRMRMLRFLATMRYESYYSQDYGVGNPSDLVASGPADWMSSFNHIFSSQTLPADASTLVTNVAFYQMRCLLVIAVVQKRTATTEWDIHTRVVVYDAIRDEIMSVQHDHYEFKALYFHPNDESHLVELVHSTNPDQRLYVQTASFSNGKEPLMRTILGQDMLIPPNHLDDPGNGFKLDLTQRTNVLGLKLGEQKHLNNGTMMMMGSEASNELHFTVNDPLLSQTAGSSAWAYIVVKTNGPSKIQYLLDDELMLPHIIVYHRNAQRFDLILLPCKKSNYESNASTGSREKSVETQVKDVLSQMTS